MTSQGEHMSENTPQNPYEPNAGGATPPPNPSGPTPPPSGGAVPPNPAGPTPPPPGPAQPPVYGGASQPPAYGGPAAPYGTQPTSPFQVGEALGFAWDRFKGNWLFWVLFVLLTFVVFVLSNAGSASEYQEQMQQLRAASDPEAQGAALGAAAWTGVSFGSGSLGIIGFLILSVLSALGINAGLREVSGEKATWGNLFKVSSYGMIILTALLLFVANVIGACLCGLGSIALAIFAPFTYHHVVDKGLGAWTAFISSFRLVGKNFGAVFLLELALLGINILGSIPFGLGLFITLPLSIVAMAFAFRRITGGPVAAGPVAA